MDWITGSASRMGSGAEVCTSAVVVVGAEVDVGSSDGALVIGICAVDDVTGWLLLVDVGTVDAELSILALVIAHSDGVSLSVPHAVATGRIMHAAPSEVCLYREISLFGIGFEWLMLPVFRG